MQVTTWLIQDGGHYKRREVECDLIEPCWTLFDMLAMPSPAHEVGLRSQTFWYTVAPEPCALRTETVKTPPHLRPQALYCQIDQHRRGARPGEHAGCSSCPRLHIQNNRPSIRNERFVVRRHSARGVQLRKYTYIDGFRDADTGGLNLIGVVTNTAPSHPRSAHHHAVPYKSRQIVAGLHRDPPRGHHRLRLGTTSSVTATSPASIRPSIERNQPFQRCPTG